jgi:hypothetical protein
MTVNREQPTVIATQALLLALRAKGEERYPENSCSLTTQMNWRSSTRQALSGRRSNKLFASMQSPRPCLPSLSFLLLLAVCFISTIDRVASFTPAATTIFKTYAFETSHRLPKHITTTNLNHGVRSNFDSHDPQRRSVVFSASRHRNERMSMRTHCHPATCQKMMARNCRVLRCQEKNFELVPWEAWKSWPLP